MAVLQVVETYCEDGQIKCCTILLKHGHREFKRYAESGYGKSSAAQFCSAVRPFRYRRSSPLGLLSDYGVRRTSSKFKGNMSVFMCI